MEFTPMIILAQKGSKIYPNTNLPITLWLKYDKKKIIYMQNNYNKYTIGNDLIPISIDKDNPRLLEDVELNVKEKDLKKVLDFIKKKHQILIDTVNGVDIDYSIMEHTHINKFKPTVIDGFFVNGISARDYHSLPVDLYLYCDVNEYDDERNLYTLLMQNTHKSNKRFEDYVTVSIDKENPRLIYDVKLGIPKEEFKRVQAFIKRHYDFLKEYTERDDMDIGDIHHYLSSYETEPWLVGSINGYSLYLYVGDYESYPHFHFVDEETKGKKFNACIKIDKAEYLNHSLNRNDKLNKKQKEDLQKLLETPFRKPKYAGTNYEFIKDMWNMNYDNKVDENLIIPNYRKLDIVSHKNFDNDNKCNNENNFNYEWVLSELNKDYDIEGIGRIGFTDDGYEVFVVTDDYMLSDVPHFHYRKKEKGKKMEFHTCIRFDKAEYYHHTGNEDVLNDSQKENLIRFLSSKPKYGHFNTNWELLLFSWEHQNNSQTVINENLTIPDYTKLVTRNKGDN